MPPPVPDSPRGRRSGSGDRCNAMLLSVLVIVLTGKWLITQEYCVGWLCDKEGHALHKYNAQKHAQVAGSREKERAEALEYRRRKPSIVSTVETVKVEKTVAPEVIMRTRPPAMSRAPAKAPSKRSMTSTAFDVISPATHHWTLGVCGTTADSSLWLREWLEIMMISNVDHVWLFNDNPRGQDDDTATILAEYEDKGFVTVVPLKVPSFLPECKGMWVESDCITPKICYKHVAPYVDYFSVTDTDEFLYPTMGCDLKHHLLTYCDPSQAYEFIRWERFGTSGHYHHPIGLMSENFLSSGGDCTTFEPGLDQKYRNTTCRKSWEHCLECKHTKVLYNVGKCINYEQVGWVHEPVNTSFWVKANKAKKFLPIQMDGISHYKNINCKERHFGEDSRECRKWMQEGGGTQLPPKPSIDCCSAGFGYNHYGTKSKEMWEVKQARRTRRGFKPADFSVIELNSTISAGILRFTRALRQSFKAQKKPVAPGVSFIDLENPPRACFAEQNWIYSPDPQQGSYSKDVPSAKTADDCCRSCYEADMGPKGRCGGWSYNTYTEKCAIFYSPHKSWKRGVEQEYLRWPRNALPASRVKKEGYISGLPMYDGECPLPERFVKEE